MQISSVLPPYAPSRTDEDQAAQRAYGAFPPHREAPWPELWREREQMRDKLQRALAPDQALEGRGNYAYQRAVGLARGHLTEAAVIAAQCAGPDAWDTADMQQVRAAHWMAVGREDLALPLVEGLLAAQPACAEALFEHAAHSDAVQVAQRALAAGATGARLHDALKAVRKREKSSLWQQAPLNLPFRPHVLRAWCAQDSAKQALADAALLRAIALGERAIAATLLHAGRPLPQNTPQGLCKVGDPSRVYGVHFVAAKCPELLADCVAVGIALNVTDPDGNTRLHELIAHGHASAECVQLLVAQGVGLDAFNARGETALSIAIENNRGGSRYAFGSASSRAAAIEMLQSLGARGENVEQAVMVRAFCAHPKELGPALMALGCSAKDVHPSPVLGAIQSEISRRTAFTGGYMNVPMQALVTQLGARVDDPDEQGNTALMLAAKAGHQDLVKQLIELGANVHVFNNSGKNALHLVGTQDAVLGTLVAAGADLEREDGLGNSALCQWEALAQESMSSATSYRDMNGATRVFSVVACLRRHTTNPHHLRLQLLPYPMLASICHKQDAEAKRASKWRPRCSIM